MRRHYAIHLINSENQIYFICKKNFYEQTLKRAHCEKNFDVCILKKKKIHKLQK